MARRVSVLLRAQDDIAPMWEVLERELFAGQTPARIALARFGRSRWHDAQRSRPIRAQIQSEDRTDEIERRLELNELQCKAIEQEQRTYDHLVAAWTALHGAHACNKEAQALRAREEKLAGGWPKEMVVDGPDLSTDLETAMRATLGAVRWCQERGRRSVPGWAEPFPSLWGLSSHARSKALRKQARALLEAGCTPEDVAFAVGLGMGKEGVAHRKKLLREFLRD